MNKIVLIGNLTADPVVRTSKNNKNFATFTVACNYRDSTSFIDCLVSERSVEYVSKYLKKGSQVVVDGRLEIRSYTDNNGNNRKAPQIVVDNIQGLSRINENPNQDQHFGTKHQFNNNDKPTEFDIDSIGQTIPVEDK